MKNILIVLTGGTICSNAKNGIRGLDTENSKTKLIYNYLSSDSKFKNDVNFVVDNPINILSENMNLDTWNTLIKYFKNVDFGKYDGIVIAHGTDTLAYTSSLLATLLKGVIKPVIFVSANTPLDDITSNGNDNFKYAIDSVFEGKISNGVWVVYKNISDSKMNVFDGENVLQIKDNSDDLYAGNFKFNIPKMLIEKVNKLKGEVLKIEPYVGINYECFNLDNVRVIIHGTYHSQTVESDKFIRFAKKCRDKKILIVLLPFDVNKQEKYSSVDGILGENIIPINNMTKEFAYCKSVVGCSIFDDYSELKDFICC